MTNLLECNYSTCTNNSTKSIAKTNIEICAEELERKALKSCMIVSLYRKSMLKIISDIRQNTTEQKLFPLFNQSKDKLNQQTQKQKRYASTQTREPPDKRYVRTQTDSQHFFTPICHSNVIKKTTRNVRTQTDMPKQSENILDDHHRHVTIKVDTLDEKIRKFEMKLKDEERKRKQFSNYVHRKEIEEKKREKYAKKIKCISPPAVFSPILDNKYQPQMTPIIIHSTPSISLTPIISTPATPIVTIPDICYFQPPIPNALLTPLPAQSQVDEDTIANELQALFGLDDNINDIFAESSVNNTQIDAIIEEIHNSDVSTEAIKDGSHSGQNNIFMSQNITKTVDNKDEIYFSHDIDESQTQIESIIDYKRELKESLWPCELHMQRMRLRRVIDSLVDKGLRHNEKIQLRFFELFGDDDDDAFNAYSPSIELDDVLLASCKKRIAHWIVKYLMRPMTDGLIANRFLFKKLAKHIAHNIIMENQYPGKNLNVKFVFNNYIFDKNVTEEYHIRTAVTNYFCEHPYIGTINDIY